MKKISKADLRTLIAAREIVRASGERCCEICAMSRDHNRKQMPCYRFIIELGGSKIYIESGGNDLSCKGQMKAIEYMINNTPTRAAVKI